MMYYLCFNKENKLTAYFYNLEETKFYCSQADGSYFKPIQREELETWISNYLEKDTVKKGK